MHACTHAEHSRIYRTTALGLPVHTCACAALGLPAGRLSLKHVCLLANVQARGTVQAGQGTARMNLMRHAVSKLEGLINSSLGVGTQQSGQEWKQTNRCGRAP